jgi:hypothetical protein
MATTVADITVPPHFESLSLPQDERAAYKLIHDHAFTRVFESWQTTEKLDVLLDSSSRKKLKKHQNIPPEPKAAIDKILQCEKDAHADILGVSENATEEETLNAWVTLGCLIQPYMKDISGSLAMIRKNKRPF